MLALDKMKMKSEFMNRALVLAKEAMQNGEIPVGAVIVKDGKIIGEGKNCCELENNATLHAETIAISKASQHLNNWRLSDCTLYVSLEPCPMCMGAIFNARISQVIFGAYNEKTGSCISCMKVEDFPLSPKPDIIGGYMGEECKKLMVDFFKNKRQ